ncbi:MAG TPA: hypothetical protein VFK94_00815, partial [Patescibacteria group bacterium]|nr:hypothetical protein [Patescibacteria group bacterium]
MRKAIKSLVLGALVLIVLNPSSVQAYSNNRMIEDQIFDDLGRMNESQIRGFLEGTEANPRLAGGSPCLKAHTNINFHWDGSNWNYGDGTKSQNGQLVAATWNTAWGPAQLPAYSIIGKTAAMWGFNPQVILSTLQKEQSLVWGTNCSSTRFNSAMGYDCPDSGGLYDYPARGVSGTCVAHERYVGFTRQVLWGSWQLKFAKERSIGNTGWNGDSGLVYGGYMTQGTYRRCG